MVDAPAGPLRIVFFGTPEFAVQTLRALLASRHAVVAVVTQPDRPRGRGQRATEGPVKAVARAHDIEVLQPARLREPSLLDRLRALGPDLGVVAAYGKILPDDLLALPRLGLINVHASLLPKYRGAAPVHRAVMAGDAQTGVTIMRVVSELDAGPMLAKETLDIGPDETSDHLEDRLAAAGARLLLSVVESLAAGSARETPQNHAEATYAPRLSKTEGVLDWSRPAAELHNQVRGLHPWPHAAAFLSGTRYLIHRTRPLPAEPGRLGASSPGTVLEASGDRLVIAAGHATALQVLEIQPEGRRVMQVREFLAGHPVSAGTRFSVP
jgi:methionyl-tRNA formyltransferase